MTREETKKFIGIMAGLYYNFDYKGSEVIDAWHRGLEHVTYQDAENALYSYAEREESDFAPSLNRILAECRRKINGVGKCSRYLCRDAGGYYFLEYDEKGNPSTRKAWKKAENLFIDEEGREYSDPGYDN